MTIEQVQVVDFVTVDRTGDVVLVMVEHRSWDPSSKQLDQLRKKVNTYLAFVDEQLPNEHPDLAGRPVIFELRYQMPLSAAVEKYLGQLSSALADHGIGFRLKQIGARPSA